MSNVVRPGGRRKGDRGHRNNGLLKRCTCPRKRWSRCPHPWWFNFRRYRFDLNARAGLKPETALSRTEAEAYRDEFRAAIRNGTFDTAPAAAAAPAPDAPALTLRAVGEQLVEAWRADPNRRPHRVTVLGKQLAAICRTLVGDQPFGDRVFAELTTADLEAFRDARRRLLRQREQDLQERRARLAAGDATARALTVPNDLPHARRGEVGINRALEVLRGLFNWAIERGLFTRENPFLRNGRPAIRMAQEQARTRRLHPGEEARLLASATGHMADLIVAALDTGLRLGELLALRWSDVLHDSQSNPRAFQVAAATSKTNRPRTVPVLSQRLLTVLARRRRGLDGRALGSDAYVFGNEVGERVGTVKTAWKATCRRAGISGLNFHDLRREAASRWLEGGVRLLTVSALLGHTQVTTTNTYLASSPTVAAEELKAFEALRNPETPAQPQRVSVSH